MDSSYQMAVRIAEAAARAGGRTYFVGGCVRDRLMGIASKDLDIEVHGVDFDTLWHILDSLGKPLTMGASFGVMGLKGCALDVAMPRAERAVGRGHRDFAVSVDPFLGEERAAARRDFTVNAMMQNVLTGELLDFFGGRDDLAKRRLRHVNDQSFPEDPLRVFRGAQFAARFGFAIAPETRALCRQMSVRDLAGERVMGELEKALLQAEKPSVFFTELREMGQLSVWFSETEALIAVPQPPRHHPEGDVWNHTMQVLDSAARLRGGSEYPLALMLAALCHDFGKAVSTAERDGQLHAYGHERAGLPIAERFLRRLTNETRLLRAVLNLTELHMQPNMLVGMDSGARAYMKLFDAALCPEELLFLSKADYLGRGGAGTEADYAPTEEKLRAMLGLYRERMAADHVMGRDLAEAGISPGPLYGEALRYAHKLRLAGVPKDEQLRQTLGHLRALARKGS